MEQESQGCAQRAQARREATAEAKHLLQRPLCQLPDFGKELVSQKSTFPMVCRQYWHASLSRCSSDIIANPC